MGTKQYIFYCALQSKNPNFQILRYRLRNNFLEQQMIAKIEFNEDILIFFLAKMELFFPRHLVMMGYNFCML